MYGERDDDLEDTAHHETPSPAQPLRQWPRPLQAITWAGWFRLTEEKSHYQDRDLWYDSQIQDNWYTSMIIPVGLEVISFGRAMVRKALTHRDQQSAQFGVSLVRQDDTLLHY